MAKSKKSKLFDHCNVETSIDTNSNIACVLVEFKEHMKSSETRVFYGASDIMEAINDNGIPAIEIVDGGSHRLNNRSKAYQSGEYKFSLLKSKSNDSSDEPSEPNESDEPDEPNEVEELAPEPTKPRRTRKTKSKS